MPYFNQWKFFNYDPFIEGYLNAEKFIEGGKES